MNYLTSLPSLLGFRGFPTITASKYTRGDGYWSTAEVGFFSKLTDVNSQRENWYEVSPYIAEFWCTVSNIAIIGSGILSQSPELVLAGTASAVSHAIPKQWLLHVDKLGVALVASRIIGNIARNPQSVMGHPALILLPLAAIAVHNADVRLSRTEGNKWSHVVWHCVSGTFTGAFIKMTSK